MLSFQIKSITMKEAMITQKFTIFLIAIIFISHFSLFNPRFTQSANADTISNENYSVDINTIDTNPQPTPKSQVLGITNVITNYFTTGPNYTISTPNSSLSIGLSQNTIDFGILSSTNPVIRTSEISIQLGGEIVTYENHPLFSASRDIIQNTTCDNGACSPEIAALWNNTLTYGFGYRCDSKQIGSCDPQFLQSNYFKQYPNDSGSQSPEAVLVSKDSPTKASITYKVTISGTQKTGGYYNSITYLAIPNF